MIYSWDIVNQVVEQNDIVEVISRYVRLKRQGRDAVGLCPFHNEKTPSFYVNPAKQVYYCHGCHQGGNVITFIRTYENYTFPEALKVLADRAGITLPEYRQTEQEKQEESLRTRLYEVQKAAAVYYFNCLARQPSGEPGRRYFRQRGLSDETVTHFGLGFAPATNDGLYRHLKEKGFADDVISESGLVRYREKEIRDYFWDRVMFPIMDINGKVVGFGGRILGSGKVKYLNSPETRLFEKSRLLYGMNFARRSKKPYVLLCEGYMDVIALHQAGFTCAVASLGTAFTGMQARLIRRYVKEVIVTYDSDGAGQAAALKAIPILRSAGLQVRILDMSPYKDPDEFIRALGSEEYEKRIDGALNSYFYEWDRLAEQGDRSDPEQETVFLRALGGRLKDIEDEIERTNYLNAAARRYHVERNLLARAVSDAASRSGWGSRDSAGGQEESPLREAVPAVRREKGRGIREAQRRVLRAVSTGEISSRAALELFTPEMFDEGVYRSVAAEILTRLKEGRPVVPAELMNAWVEEDAESGEAAGIFFPAGDGREEEEDGDSLQENVRRLLRVCLDRRIEEEKDPVRLLPLIRKKEKLETETYDFS